MRRKNIAIEVAAEFLIPSKKLDRMLAGSQSIPKIHIKHLPGRFKVSPLVVARRVLDMNLISKSTFFVFYNQYQEEWKNLQIEEEARR